MNRKYYYFATHYTNPSVYDFLKAGVEYKSLTKKEKTLLVQLAENYKGREKGKRTLDYCSEFINNNSKDFQKLMNTKGYALKYFLRDYLGFHFKWQSSMTSFNQRDQKITDQLISEDILIEELCNPNSAIKKLLDTAQGDLDLVKGFLPAIIISLNANTRDPKNMKFQHTGRFCFDFDGFENTKEALKWMNKVWKGTQHIKPYMAFISPRGKGFKMFYQVDISNEDFINDFVSEVKDEVTTKHKILYEVAKKETLQAFSELTDNFDDSTKDVQRFTLIPFIANKKEHFKYAPEAISEYTTLVEQEKEQRRIEKEKKLKKHEAEVNALMQKEGIKSKDDAYNLVLKNRSDDFDLEFELDKFKKVVAFIVDLAKRDNRVKKWLEEKFTSYEVLNNQCWILYGVFGSIAIDELKKLIPFDSNKLDENHGDYRWANKSDDTYDEESRKNLKPAPFYKLVFEIGKVKDFVLGNFAVTSSHISNFKLINEYYENYKYNLDLNEGNKKNADLSEFLKKIRLHLDAKKIRLPLIKDLEEMQVDVKLGPKDYLDKDVMKNLFQIKYAEKKIFALRSQCGTSCAVLERDLQVIKYLNCWKANPCETTRYVSE